MSQVIISICLAWRRCVFWFLGLARTILFHPCHLFPVHGNYLPPSLQPYYSSTLLDASSVSSTISFPISSPFNDILWSHSHTLPISPGKAIPHSFYEVITFLSCMPSGYFTRGLRRPRGVVGPCSVFSFFSLSLQCGCTSYPVYDAGYCCAYRLPPRSMHSLTVLFSHTVFLCLLSRPRIPLLLSLRLIQTARRQPRYRRLSAFTIPWALSFLCPYVSSRPPNYTRSFPCPLEVNIVPPSPHLPGFLPTPHSLSPPLSTFSSVPLYLV
ncbi:hypothetical protein FA95DRAFT_917721 [Auriscalpium vulgare]|uniref:Uncharacterized protein n=1 Tax=Auriscalpium vulgare TaxID=40419 RepID=A0ACB8RZX2_9AGAM|nr:hypothetical protein FA95DRAFT_917721 [Auriscalpium vulgare]